MTRIWKWNRPVTVREVLEDLQQERSIAYTTVMTVMDNLHQKGWVRRQAEGRAYRYQAVSTRAAYSAALMNEAWARSDNPAAALVAFFGMMSPVQREALRDAVRMVQDPENPSPPENGGNPVGAENGHNTPATANADRADNTDGADSVHGADTADIADKADNADTADGAGNTEHPGASEASEHREAPEHREASGRTEAVKRTRPSGNGRSDNPAAGGRPGGR